MLFQIFTVKATNSYIYTDMVSSFYNANRKCCQKNAMIRLSKRNSYRNIK